MVHYPRRETNFRERSFKPLRFVPATGVVTWVFQILDSLSQSEIGKYSFLGLAVFIFSIVVFGYDNFLNMGALQTRAESPTRAGPGNCCGKSLLHPSNVGGTIARRPAVGTAGINIYFRPALQ